MCPLSRIGGSLADQLSHRNRWNTHHNTSHSWCLRNTNRAHTSHYCLWDPNQHRKPRQHNRNPNRAHHQPKPNRVKRQPIQNLLQRSKTQTRLSLRLGLGLTVFQHAALGDRIDLVLVFGPIQKVVHQSLNTNRVGSLHDGDGYDEQHRQVLAHEQNWVHLGGRSAEHAQSLGDPSGTLTRLQHVGTSEEHGDEVSG